MIFFKSKTVLVLRRSILVSLDFNEDYTTVCELAVIAFYQFFIPVFSSIAEVERKNIHIHISFMAMMKCHYGYFKAMTTILSSAS